VFYFDQAVFKSEKTSDQNWQVVRVRACAKRCATPWRC